MCCEAHARQPNPVTQKHCSELYIIWNTAAFGCLSNHSCASGTKLCNCSPGSTSRCTMDVGTSLYEQPPPLVQPPWASTPKGNGDVHKMWTGMRSPFIRGSQAVLAHLLLMHHTHSSPPRNLLCHPFLTTHLPDLLTHPPIRFTITQPLTRLPACPLADLSIPSGGTGRRHTHGQGQQNWGGFMQQGKWPLQLSLKVAHSLHDW